MKHSRKKLKPEDLLEAVLLNSCPGCLAKKTLELFGTADFREEIAFRLELLIDRTENPEDRKPLEIALSSLNCGESSSGSAGHIQ